MHARSNDNSGQFHCSALARTGTHLACLPSSTNQQQRTCMIRVWSDRGAGFCSHNLRASKHALHFSMSALNTPQSKLISTVISSVASSSENGGGVLKSSKAHQIVSEDGWITVSRATTENVKGDSTCVEDEKNVSKCGVSKKQSAVLKSIPTNPTKLSRSAKRNLRRSRKRLEAREDREKRQPQDFHEEGKDEFYESCEAAFCNSSPLLSLPYSVVTGGIISFLAPKDIAKVAQTSKRSKRLAEEGFLWQAMFKERFPHSKLTQSSMREWKLAYQLTLSQIINEIRCPLTKKSFFEDVIGVGLDYTVNPKTRCVDYICTSSDLLSREAFYKRNVRADAFGNEFKLFLPLYFSEVHFQRALPQLRATVHTLSTRPGSTRFRSCDILDVFPKLVNTFVVLLADEGISASKKSFDGLTRIHRLFLALVHEYPEVKREALKRLKRFIASEENRTKDACRNLGDILPLLLVVDEDKCSWDSIRSTFLAESFDRSVLWICKKYPRLQQISRDFDSSKRVEERVDWTRKAMTVNLRLLMFNASFLRRSCRGTTQQRAKVYDLFYGQPQDANESAAEAANPRSFTLQQFRDEVNAIMVADTWSSFFDCVGARRPATKSAMAALLRTHVVSSERKRYHKKGMDYSRVQASGTSKILAKGQECAVSTDLRSVTFTDSWKFEGETKFLDASCLVYRGKTRVCTVDYQHLHDLDGSVIHSGDVMHDEGGVHTIDINLANVDPTITAFVFVLSAWASATLSDILSPSVSFKDAANNEVLCSYDLDSHDKVPHLTAVIMCALRRSTRTGKWHVQAIGDSHRGAADSYAPIFDAVDKLM